MIKRFRGAGVTIKGVLRPGRSPRSVPQKEDFIMNLDLILNVKVVKDIDDA
jgi:hypothetical protein